MVEGIGAPSREAQIPALLDLMGIPYTGSDPTTLCITLDKARTKEILAYSWHSHTCLFACLFTERGCQRLFSARTLIR
jgi:hypothetical protein